MALPDESLVKDIWSAMWEVQMHARREKVSGPLRDFGKVANNCFEQWSTKPDALRKFAEMALPAPQETTRQLQQLQSDTAQACIRVISLLKKAADG